MRQPSYTIAVRTSAVGWGRSPFVEGVLAPPLPRLGDLGACSCVHIPGPRFEGHLVTRDWQAAPCCGVLSALCGYESLAQRTYPSLPSLLKTTTERVSRVLRQAGCPQDVRDVLTSAVLARFSDRLRRWLSTVPPFLLRGNIYRAMRPVHAAGCLFVRVDRSPGRVILLCSEAWLALHLPVFVCSTRYLHSELQTDEDFTEWASSSLRSVLCQTCSSLRVRPGPRSGMPYAY